MKILIVSPQLPYPPAWGFAIRVYQLARYLSQRHSVTVLAYRLPHEEAELQALLEIGTLQTVPAPRSLWRTKRLAQLSSLASTHSYRWTSLQSGEMAQAIRSLTGVNRFDVIQVESSPMAWFAAGETPLVIDEHNVEYELLHRMHDGERSAGRRLYNWIEFLKLRGEEQAAWRRAAGVVLTSEREAVTLRQTVPGVPTSVVPNSVDAEYFRPSDAPESPTELVFTGALNYRPNVDAVLFFAREVLPRIHERHPSLHFTVVGGAAPPEVLALRGARVTLTGAVADVRPYLRAAAVIVVPLRMGSGTRLKVLEGMAMSKALVSTTVGVEGLAVRNEQHLLIADDAASFAAQVLRLINDRDQRTTLGREGRALVEREYTWEAAGQRLERFYAALVGRAEQVA